MKVLIKNRFLIEAQNFLQDLKLKGAESRARTKFSELLDRAIESYAQSELALAKEYAILDDNGEIKFGENYLFDLRPGTAPEYHSEVEKLHNEEAEIEGETYATHLETMLKTLHECDVEMSGSTAALYDMLCEAFEEAAKESGGKA